jgi:hypothetical protein
MRKLFQIILFLAGFICFLGHCTLNAETYKIGNINVDTEKREIELYGTVQKNKEWVQFLFYAKGYKWLKDECAIVLDTDLGSLQNAIALLDWRLWQKLWQERTRDENIKVTLNWDDKEKIKPDNLIKTNDKTGFVDLIFLGSPYFDQIVLGSTFSGPCSSCPLFTLEETALRKLFVRPSGKSGYILNTEKMPPVGTKVMIKIKFIDIVK